MARKIPAAGMNLFQLIYILIREYEEATGRSALDLSLGNPDTVPPPDLLELQARFANDPAFALHTYAEDNDLNGFAEAMVELHGGIRVADHQHLEALPIPGIKTAGALTPLACGLHLPDAKARNGFSLASNLPAYDVIGTWSQSYLGVRRVVWPLISSDAMRLDVGRLESAVKAAGLDRVDLVYVIRPGNPASVGPTAGEWKPLLEYCVAHETRLVNDAAYAGLAGDDHLPLARAALDFPDLEWLELYSVSKSFSDPGARLGALVGSRDFVADFNLVKGNTESGPVPYVMAAYGEFFRDRTRAREALQERRDLYGRRLRFLVPRLLEAGLEPACPTDAGFFTLWRVPEKAFGIRLAEDPRTRDLPAHEAFNRLVIAETGIVGVHFMGPGRGGSGEPLIRYAVCTDVFDEGFQERLQEGLARLAPQY